MSRIGSWIASTFPITVLLTLAGALVGAIMSAVSYHQAQAAVRVRPELANVGFVDAALTMHGGDWLFYHEPVLGTAIVVGLMGTFGLVSGVK